MQLNISILSNFLNLALSEDLGINGDITSNTVINKKTMVNFQIIAKQDMILCGSSVADWYFEKFAVKDYSWQGKDGAFIKKNTIILSGKAKAETILLLERTVLNFMQHLSGVATHTQKFVKEVEGLGAKIADTRKTIPGMRALQKYAVRCGGGINHRLALDSAIMIKDNHIMAAGSIKNAFVLANQNKPHYTKIIVECDTMEQFKEALSAGAEIILLDNMTPENVEICSEINNGRVLIEVSGGINLSNVRKYAQAGADIISVGAITHSSPACDISLDII
ncbi:MAG: carboxylating nicotinate-nucleotide diphosphorylase [Rickettsiaceae bacterium]|nr:carboxylating nicotinate-nucleotide diphosphorylase [Rickettsiaceae bacterium]